MIAIKVLVRVLLFSIVVTCTVFSKLSLISLVSRLNKTIDDIRRTNDSEATLHDRAAGFFWQLLFIILIPQFVTFFRALLFGVCGKQSRLFPWPTLRAILTGVFEVLAMAVIVFYVLPHLPSIVAIFVLSGVFSFEAFLDCWQYPLCPRNECKGYESMDKQNLVEQVLENKLSKTIATALQAISSIVLVVCAGFLQSSLRDSIFVALGMAFCLFTLAVVWSSKMQEIITHPKRTRKPKTPQAVRVPKASMAPIAGNQLLGSKQHYSGWLNRHCSYTCNFISAILRITLYPFISYIIFRYVFTNGSIDPWCLHRTCSLSKSFQWKGQELAIFLIQILSSFFGYTFMWISCTMVLHRWGLALPLYLCTPISFAVCAIFQVIQGSLAGATLWIGQMMTRGVTVWKKKNLILAKDAAMFLTPRYDGIFLEQYTMLNRQVAKREMLHEKFTPTLVINKDVIRPRTVFICSTMYQENSEEMDHLLSSIHKLAKHCKEKNNDDCFESHIFMDNGVNGTQLTYFALQLLSLFCKEEFEMCPMVIATPYGAQLKWNVAEVMPIYVHLKDSAKIKKKKRWSQVMYMNYVLNYREKRDTTLDDDNTFILTTDADIQFTPESATVLLDILDSDPRVGAVCARTHPKGSGPLYWYQVFEYAIGHWFQKSAEHVLGTVLCCPGCFSVFRCSALRSILDTYSTEVTSTSEFLTKDMGEDRWLCTLLVENGWKLEYCPTSENYTHCPESFDEFFKQRKRWIPSTIANLSLLITQASKVTKRNENVSIPFVIFQGILVFSTAISPATVILVIASGSLSAFNISHSSIMAIIIILSLLSIAYGILESQNLIYEFVAVQEMYGPCTINAIPSMSTCQNSTGFVFPLTPSNMYLVLFTLLFISSGLFHLNEFSCLIHGVWYFLALPSGYLILLIYSVANLDDLSWGTREGSTGALQDGFFEKIKCVISNAWQKMLRCFKKEAAKQNTVVEYKQPPASCDAATGN
eukprot:Em0359g7a